MRKKRIAKMLLKKKRKLVKIMKMTELNLRRSTAGGNSGIGLT
jgi:hypothetical protein